MGQDVPGTIKGFRCGALSAYTEDFPSSTLDVSSRSLRLLDFSKVYVTSYMYVCCERVISSRNCN